jgi:HAD superfamily hydrolase (TIGR01509 family)
LHQHGVKTAVVSSSRNCQTVLQAAQIEDLFPVRVDGRVVDEMDLPGKPSPDMFLMAARDLGVPPEQAVVVEDAIAGVRAGKAGGFGLVVGIARSGEEQALRAAGADLVVADLSEWV